MVLQKRLEEAVKFVETKPVNLKGYTLVEGFPGMGLVGTIATKYLVERMKMQQIGYLESEVFVPIIRIHDGLPIHPSRIYVHNEKKLVVLVSEQIVPQQFTEKLARALVDWVEKKGIERVVSLSGIRASGDEKAKDVYGIACDFRSKDFLKKQNVEVIKEGITTGVTAVILLELRDRKVDAFSLLGNVKITADYKAAASIIKKLNEIFELSIDVKPLMKEAKETETALLDQLKKMKQTQEEIKKTETRTPMYT